MDSVVHFEIPSANSARAKKFYSSVFGWKAKEYPKMNYTIWSTVEVDKKTMRPKTPGAINGGMIKRGKIVKAPVIYMYVKDIDSTIAKVKKQGGNALGKKAHVQGDMYTAYFKDSEGNVMGLVQGMM